MGSYYNPFINEATPNLNTYKDSEGKFKGINIVYPGYIRNYDGPGATNLTFKAAELYTDAENTVPLTLTQMVNMIENGLPIAAPIGNRLCFATGTFDVIEFTDDDEMKLWRLGLVFATLESKIEGSNLNLAYVPVIGTVDFTEEAANGNLESGKRPHDGIEEEIIGCNVNAFTIAVGRNIAAQKVIPNPFSEN